MTDCQTNFIWSRSKTVFKFKIVDKEHSYFIDKITLGNQRTLCLSNSVTLYGRSLIGDYRSQYELSSSVLDSIHLRNSQEVHRISVQQFQCLNV